MLLYILLVIAVLFILGQAWLLYIFVNRIAELSGSNEALEQGFSEVTDAYESDSLQYEETIEKLHEQLEAECAKTCQALAKVGRRNKTIDALTIDLGTVRSENLHLRRQLDIAQVIISEHDANCLPHIVLSSVQTDEKDTPLPL